MKLISVIVQIFLILPVYCSIQIPQTWNCENKLTLNWLWNLRNNNRCVNLIIESIFVPKCIYDQILRSNLAIKMFDFATIKSRNVYSIPPTNCENFIFFVQNSTEISGLFVGTNRTKRFVPFSQLVLVTPNDIKFDQNVLNYIYQNGLFAFEVKNTLSTHSSNGSFNELRFLNLRNVLTAEILNLTTSDRDAAILYFGTHKTHPFFNREYREKVFRVSLFKCVPYIIYLPDGSFDGIQYRMLKEITKPWTIAHNKCDFSSTIKVPWNTVLDNVDNEISDLAMCSIWMNKPLSQYDPSTYFDLQCGTFLVPKPQSLNPATYLYLSLNANDWYGFAASLIVMSLCFSIFSKIGRKSIDSWRDLLYTNFGRSLMDAIDMATSHGLVKFPKEHSMKFLLTSWLVVSFIVGVGYSTGYTCLLNKPVFSKPIDTLEQLVQSDLVVLVNNGDFAKNLIQTGSESNIQLAKHVIFDNDTIDSTIRVKRVDKQAVFVKVILKNYIGEINNMTDPQYRLRIMKSCILNQYTVVVMKKYSTYTRYVNEKIRRLQESGLISHWGLSIEGANSKYMRPYFADFGSAAEGPKKLSIQNLGGAFWLLLIGLVAATTTLIFEKIFQFKKSVRQNSSSNYDLQWKRFV